MFFANDIITDVYCSRPTSNVVMGKRKSDDTSKSSSAATKKLKTKETADQKTKPVAEEEVKTAEKEDADMKVESANSESKKVEKGADKTALLGRNGVGDEGTGDSNDAKVRQNDIYYAARLCRRKREIANAPTKIPKSKKRSWSRTRTLKWR